MKRFLLLLLLIVGGLNIVAQNPFTSHKKILFIGNSITYTGTYIVDIETYLRLKYPEAKAQIVNVGLPSETISGLSEPGHADGKFPRPDLRERLTRVLALVKPDLVFATYGINDGIYLPFDEGRFAKYREGIKWMHDEIVKSGAEIVHITAPYYDERRAGNPGYENTMDRYSEWLTSLKDSGWTVVDTYNPMKQYLNAHREVDEKFHLDGFELAGDGVHPNDNGHWLMARSILTAMNEHDADTVASVESFAGRFKNGKEILEKIREKQSIMKDAWLTAIRHKRPGMNKGLHLEEAKKKEKILHNQIDALNRAR